MNEINKNQLGINNVSNEWFKAHIDRKTLKNLSKRNDYDGWKHIIIYTLTLSSLGVLSVYFWQSWFFIPVYLAYCMFWGGADAIWHECGHRTAFKTRKLNDFFYYIASFMNNFEPVRWRWSHSLHHSYTASIDPHDYEVELSIFAKHTLISFLFIFIPGIGFLKIHKSLYIEIIKHALGIRTNVLKDCIPEDKVNSCINSSRVFVIFWLAIITSSIYLNSLLPILLFLVPKFFATFNSIWGITQHMGLKENEKDHRLSTRSVRLNPIFSFIYWKMEYHIEHHMFPMVPSYNLPKLYDKIKNQLPKPQTLYEAYKEIIPAVIKKSKNPDYYIPVNLPNN
jgi:fatty acid desaturase